MSFPKCQWCGKPHECVIGNFHQPACDCDETMGDIMPKNPRHGEAKFIKDEEGDYGTVWTWSEHLQRWRPQIRMTEDEWAESEFNPDYEDWLDEEEII